MSADILRRAAQTLREHAEKATPGPWWTVGSYVAAGIPDASCNCAGLEYTGHEPDCGAEPIMQGCEPDVRHAALMHPGVALALADWLEREAHWRAVDPRVGPIYPVALARLILGEAS